MPLVIEHTIYSVVNVLRPAVWTNQNNFAQLLNNWFSCCMCCNLPTLVPSHSITAVICTNHTRMNSTICTTVVVKAFIQPRSRMLVLFVQPASRMLTFFVQPVSRTLTFFIQPASRTLILVQPASRTLILVQPASRTLLLVQPMSKTLVFVQPIQPMSRTLVTIQPASRTLDLFQPVSRTFVLVQPMSRSLILLIQDVQPASRTLIFVQPTSRTLVLVQPTSRTLVLVQPASRTLILLVQDVQDMSRTFILVVQDVSGKLLSPILDYFLFHPCYLWINHLCDNTLRAYYTCIANHPFFDPALPEHSAALAASPAVISIFIWRLGQSLFICPNSPHAKHLILLASHCYYCCYGYGYGYRSPYTLAFLSAASTIFPRSIGA